MADSIQKLALLSPQRETLYPGMEMEKPCVIGFALNVVVADGSPAFFLLLLNFSMFYQRINKYQH
jgi:hypothetical protein